MEKNFIKMGAFEDFGILKITPKIDINDNFIYLTLPDITLRKKLENNITLFSTALPENLIILQYFLTKDEKKIILKFSNIENLKLNFKNIFSYYNSIKDMENSSVFLDKNHIISLKKYPSILITGATGSGKSVLAQNILLYGLFKKWQICVLDFKKSYYIFSDFCTCKFELDEIINELQELLDELHERQRRMKEILSENPAAIACDYDFPLKLIIIEEFVALRSSINDKKQRDFLDASLKELVMLGRSLSIHCIFVMQVSKADDLNSSIRANLPVKIIMGNAGDTILRTTFDDFSDKLTSKLELGEGLIQVDGVISILSVPYFSWSNDELEEIITQARICKKRYSRSENSVHSLDNKHIKEQK